MDKRKAPEIIYLQDELGEITWCKDRITENDIEYIRADKNYWQRAIKAALALGEDKDIAFLLLEEALKR